MAVTETLKNYDRDTAGNNTPAGSDTIGADLDNHLKAAIDALQEGGAIADDKQISCLTAAWADHNGCQITVSPDVGAAA